jgi:hypothetical protein
VDALVVYFFEEKDIDYGIGGIFSKLIAFKFLPLVDFFRGDEDVLFCLLFGSSIFIMATRRDIVRQNPVLGIFQESH